MQVSKLESSKAFDHNRKVLLALFFLARGIIQRYSRLQLAAYQLKKDGLLHYKFKEKCSWGPADCEFHADLHRLCGDITFEFFKSSNGELHGEYRLYKAVNDEAKEYANEIKQKDPSKFNKLKKVAKIVGQPAAKMTSIELFHKFAREFKDYAK